MHTLRSTNRATSTIGSGGGEASCLQDLSAHSKCPIWDRHRAHLCFKLCPEAGRTEQLVCEKTINGIIKFTLSMTEHEGLACAPVPLSAFVPPAPLQQAHAVGWLLQRLGRRTLGGKVSAARSLVTLSAPTVAVGARLAIQPPAPDLHSACSANVSGHLYAPLASAVSPWRGRLHPRHQRR